MYGLMQGETERRRQLFSEANRARSRGKSGHAIAIYRQLLCDDEGDVDVLLRLAPMLAREGEHFEAWGAFRQVGKQLLADRRHEECLAAFREATRTLPIEFEAWRLTAELERKLGREGEAFETLLEGRRQFRPRFVRAQAIALLKLARQIHPWDHAVVMDLARLYIQTDQPGQAMQLLDGALVHATTAELPDVRWAQFQLTRSLRYFGLWLRLASRRSMGRTHDEPEDESRPDPEIFARYP